MAFSGRVARAIALRAGAFLGRGATRAWHVLFQNRVAIGIASLAWLILRSGSQPRRLSYPCQKAAAANVGVWAAALVPTAFIRTRHPQHALAMPYHGHVPFRRRALILGRTLVVASLLLVVGWAGLRAYDLVAPPQATFVPPGPPIVGDPVPATVAFVKGTLPITDAQIPVMVADAVAKAGGLEGIVHPGDTVVLKPNLVESGDSGTSGIVTDPRVVKAVADLARAAGATTVKIAEGTASDKDRIDWGRGVTFKAYRDAGYWTGSGAKVFKLDNSIELVDLNDAGDCNNIVPPCNPDPNKVALVTIPNGILRTQYWIPKVLLRPDQGGTCNVLITVPVFKNHGNAAVTLALKNRVGTAPSDIYYHPDYPPNMKWGLVHTVDKFPRSDDLSADVPAPTTDENTLVNYSIVDLNLVRPQDFVVVDGLVGITNGPVGDNGVVTRPSPYLGMVMASRDSVALDTVGALAMGYDPTTIAYIWWAAHRELGTTDTSAITVLGNHVAAVRKVFPQRDGSTFVELMAPQMTDISVYNNDNVWGTVPIVGSGVSDNVGVVKAELEVDGQLTATNRIPPQASFQWDSTTVADGQHTIKVTVYDAALNERAISRNVYVTNTTPWNRPDFNHDGSVDLNDFSLFQLCFNGPNRPPTSTCTYNADLDGDGDVDLSDFSVFQGCFNGPNRPPACQ
jgi:uncharacterized protein (DUF362 family)